MPGLKRKRADTSSLTTPAKKSKAKSLLSRDRLLKLSTPKNDLLSACDTNANCGLFKLPTEIRLKIYTYVLGHRYIKIEYKPHIHRQRQKNGVRFKEHIPGGLWHHCHDETDWKRRVDRLRLISRTCRQIYADTTVLHFSLNIFSFNNSWVMKKWLDSLRPGQKRALERLDLSNCELLKTRSKQLYGLKKVYSCRAWKSIDDYLKHDIGRWVTVRDLSDGFDSMEE